MKYTMFFLCLMAFVAVGCCPGQKVDIRYPQDDLNPNRIEQTAPIGQQSSPIKSDDCDQTCPGCDDGCPRR